LEKQNDFEKSVNNTSEQIENHENTKSKSNIKFFSFFLIAFLIIFAILMLFKNPINNDLKKAPDFSITTFKGKKITLSKLNDKPVVVNVWASWCGPCRDEAPELEKFWRKYKGRIYMIGLNYADEKEDALAFIKEFSVTYPNGPDESQIAKNKLKITGVPETFIIKDGLIQEHIVGVTTFKELSEMVDKLL